MIRAVGVVVALGLGVLLAGCSEQQSDPPLPGSLEELVTRVAEVRGLEAPDELDVRYLPRSGIPALLDELLTEDDRAIMAEVTTLYRLLGYIANDQTYLEVYRSFGQGSILGL
ncbi:MAG TPA: hypothetical protein VFK32_05805, partial [Tepidiformaceae bacterium]|nr:hypothetical protein [Tepidiformaceae bacterium]